MNHSDSCQDKSFVVADPGARLRRDDNRMAFALGPGGQFRSIPQGSTVRMPEVQVAQAGSQRSIVFGRAASADGGQVLGWTSTRNLEGSS